MNSNTINLMTTSTKLMSITVDSKIVESNLKEPVSMVPFKPTNIDTKISGKVSDEIRQRLINCVVNNGMKIVDAADLLNVNYSNARAIMQVFYSTGRITSQKKGGRRNVKITDNVLAAISRWLDENPALTLCQIQQLISDEFILKVSTKTISSSIKKLGYSFKLTRLVPESRNTPESIELRFEYATKFASEAPTDHVKIIYLDETGFNLHLRRKQGRSKKGTRAVIPVQSNKGKNISIAAAIYSMGLLDYAVNIGAFNTNLFYQFIERICDELRLKNLDGCWFVMDNVKFHHSKDVIELIKSRSHFPVFLPPYSPMLNPIEMLFSKWKSLIKTTPTLTSQDNLLNRIEEATTKISINDCQGWIRRSQVYFRDCLNKREIKCDPNDKENIGELN